jgi:hypothetical protein
MLWHSSHRSICCIVGHAPKSCLVAYQGSEEVAGKLKGLKRRILRASCAALAPVLRTACVTVVDVEVLVQGIATEHMRLSTWAAWTAKARDGAREGVARRREVPAPWKRCAATVAEECLVVGERQFSGHGREGANRGRWQRPTAASEWN